MVMRNFLALVIFFNFYSFSLASEIIDTLDLLPLEDNKIIMETKYEFNYENNSLLGEDEFYNLGIYYGLGNGPSINIKNYNQKTLERTSYLENKNGDQYWNL